MDRLECAGVILLLGNCDCEFEIPKLIRNLNFPNVVAAVDYVINADRKVICKVKRRLPVKLIVHLVIARRLDVAPIVGVQPEAEGDV
jgi:hypothetical protein